MHSPAISGNSLSAQATLLNNSALSDAPSSGMGQGAEHHGFDAVSVASSLFMLFATFFLVWVNRCYGRRILSLSMYGAKFLEKEMTWNFFISSVLRVVSRSITTILSLVYKGLLWCTSSTLSISLFSRKIVIADPSMEGTLAKHASETSLALVMSLVGRRMFNLSDETIQRITEYNPRPVHAHEFTSATNARVLLDQAVSLAQERFESQPQVQEVELGSWVFKLTLASMATVLWGPENPWNKDEEFVNHFMVLNKTLPTLLRPFPKLTARRAYEARSFLVDKLQSHHRENGRQSSQVAHRINIVGMSDLEWETNPDYINMELLFSLGLIVTPGTIAVWLVRHLLSNPSILEKVIAEVRNEDLVDAHAGRLDTSRIREGCPTLVASVHETMRLHMTAIPRVAQEDFEIGTPSSSKHISIKKGDIIFLPMSSFNMDRATWGSSVKAFYPQRFLNSNGSVSSTTVRKIRTFGVAGNLCPGRKLGFEAVLFVIAMLLRDFDITQATGEPRKFEEPIGDDKIGFGFEGCGEDVRVKLRRYNAGEIAQGTLSSPCLF